MFKHQYQENISGGDLPCGKETAAEKKTYKAPEKIDYFIPAALQELFIPSVQVCVCTSYSGRQTALTYNLTIVVVCGR